MRFYRVESGTPTNSPVSLSKIESEFNIKIILLKLSLLDLSGQSGRAEGIGEDGEERVGGWGTTERLS